MKKLVLIVLAVLVVGAAGGTAWWRFVHRADPMVLGQDLLKAGDLRGAALQLRAAVRANPNDAVAHLRLGTTLLQLGDAVAAEKELRLAQAGGAKSDTLHVMLAQAALAQGHNKELLAEFQPPEPSPDLTAQLLMIRALASASLGDASAALLALQTAEQVSPKSASVPLTAARLAMAQNNLALAASEVDRALSLDPKRPDGILLRAEILRSRGNRAAALLALDDALTLAPHYAQAQLERANLLLELGNDAKARIDVDDVLKSQPNSAAAVYLNAVLLARAQDNAGADAVFQRLNSVIDRFPRGFFFQALVKLNLGQLEQARDFAQRYVTRAPNDPDGIKLLARVQIAIKRPDLAIETITKASKSGLADAEMLDLLAAAYTAAGRPEDAASARNRAVTLAPALTQGDGEQSGVQLGQSLAQLGTDKSSDLSSLTRIFASQAETQATPLRGNSARSRMVTALGEGDVTAAAAALAQLRIEEGNTESVGLLNGALLAMRQEYDGAEKQYRDLIAADPQSVRPRLALAQLQMLQGNTEVAQQSLVELLANDPANETKLAAVVPLLLRTQNTPRATLLLESAVAAAPDNTKIGQTLAYVYLRAGMPEKTLTEIERETSKGQPLTIDQLQLRAAALIALHRSPDAIEAFSQLLLKAPGTVPVIQQLVALNVEAKNFAAATDVVQTALKTRPDDINLLHMLISIDLVQGGDTQALAAINKLNNDPITKPLVPRLRADFDMYRLRFLDAAEEYVGAFKTTPSSQLAVSAADAYIKAGQTGSALNILNTWLATTPNDPAALTIAADVHIQNDQLADAAPMLLRILTTQPANPAALNNLAWVYAQQKDPRSVEYARRAFTLYPSPATGETLGWSLSQTGDPKAALLLMTKAAAALPDDPTVQYHYAVTLKQVGNKPEALAVLQKLAERTLPFPEQDDARKLALELRNVR